MTDTFDKVGDVAERVVASTRMDIQWDGETITEPGVYKGIELEDYHNKLDLLDSHSVSKSVLNHMTPPNGSGKKFWHHWAFNPNRITPEPSSALNMGKAVHAALLGDEVFADSYAVRPIEFDSWRTNAAKDWKAKQEAAGKTVLLPEQMDKINAMYEDAARHPIVKAGILNGRAERSMFWKDEETGIWLRSRPDMIPGDHSAIFVDLKSVGKMDQDFIERQIAECGYYLQAAMARMCCRGLGVPFDSFVMVYVSTGDTPDTSYAELYEQDIDRGEQVIRACLKQIQSSLKTGDWPGADICNAGSQPIQMKQWHKSQLDDWIIRQEQDAA